MLDELIAELSLPENETKRLKLLLCLLTNNAMPTSTVSNRNPPITLENAIPDDTSIVHDTSTPIAETKVHKTLLDVPGSIQDMIFAFIPQDYIAVRGVAKRFHDKRLLSCELLNALEHYYLTSMNEAWKREEKAITYTTRIPFDDFVMTHAMRVSLIIKDVGDFVKDKLYIFDNITKSEKLKKRGPTIMHLCCAVTYYCATPYTVIVPRGLYHVEHEKLSTAFLYGIRGGCKSFLKLQMTCEITRNICAMWLNKPVWTTVYMKGCNINDDCMNILLRHPLEEVDISQNNITDASIEIFIECYKKNKTKFRLTENCFTMNGKLRLMRTIPPSKLEI